MSAENKGIQEDEVIVEIEADLQELVPGFLNNRNRDIRMLESAIEAGDFDRVRRIGHTMAGDCGTYGFDVLTPSGLKLEEAGTKSDSAQATKALDDLRSIVSKIQVRYVRNR